MIRELAEKLSIPESVLWGAIHQVRREAWVKGGEGPLDEHVLMTLDRELRDIDTGKPWREHFPAPESVVVLIGPTEKVGLAAAVARDALGPEGSDGR